MFTDSASSSHKFERVTKQKKRPATATTIPATSHGREIWGRARDSDDEDEPREGASEMAVTRPKT
jgi:hypothetical protein